MATERAYAMAKWLGRNHGLLVGVSAAAAVAASLQVAEAEAAVGRDAVIVTILCDSADKYLSEHFWTERDESRPSGMTAGDEALAAKLG
jgi:cysteine synthase B